MKTEECVNEAVARLRFTLVKWKIEIRKEHSGGNDKNPKKCMQNNYDHRNRRISKNNTKW
jgi:hypothetical protein